MKITKKETYLLEVKATYTYRIYENGNNEISIEVQRTEDFKKCTMKNYAIASTSKENFEKRITVDYINNLFAILRRKISEYGSYATIEDNDLPNWDN